MAVSKRRMIICGLFTLFALLLLLALPLSNLFIRRVSLAEGSDPEFKPVSDVLSAKCADCHTRDLAEYPLYRSFPLANQIIGKNIENGRRSFLLDRSKLSGKTAFSQADLLRLSQALAKGNMPPLQYLLLHWDSALSAKEEKLLLSWVKRRLLDYDIKPVSVKNFAQLNKDKVLLGKMLFEDQRLSQNSSFSCASCHDLSKGGTDRLARAKGFNLHESALNTPSVLNAAYNHSFYWDGRVRDLKAQVACAVENPDELASNWTLILDRLKKDSQLKTGFAQVYADGLNKDNICDAIAEYQRSLIAENSRFDKYLNGDQAALSAEEKEGFELFKKHDCLVCHSGPALGGLSYEKLGAAQKILPEKNAETHNRQASSLLEQNESNRYKGRFNVTHIQSDLYKVKVPALRNVELSYPYFHDGSVGSLELAVKLMSENQIQTPLTEAEQKKVTAFLRSLSGKLPESAKLQTSKSK